MLRKLFAAFSRTTPDASSQNERGIAAWHSGDLIAAETCFRQALRAQPEYAAASSNLGMILMEQRRFDEGMDFLKRAVSQDETHVGARINLANVLAYDGQSDAAIQHYQVALRLNPENAIARMNYVKPSMDACDWQVAEAETSRLEAEFSRGAGDWASRVIPLVSLLLPLPPQIPMAVAADNAAMLRSRHGFAREQIQRLRPQTKNAKIRLAYLSGDFRNNAVGHQIAGMFDHHERNRFEIVAYSWGRDDASSWRRRIEAGCDRFVDISAESFEQSASRIARDGVDIMVNLSGYGGGNRNEIFAMRPAPLQIQWLAYPGTMAADFIDYVIADEIVLPPENEPQFTEAVVRLPHCYQVNDDRQPIAATTPSRQEVGLPETGFVFCSFNQSYKVDRHVFACWMRLLDGVPGSVLWLLVTSATARANLCAAAAAAGVAPQRLIFAGPLPKPEHLARHRLADLFLDTWRINGGTTASDALWAGLPLLTVLGRGFGTRVAASLLHSLGLPELIARDTGDYERIALHLARNPDVLRAVQARLEEAKKHSPLFDTRVFVLNFEKALEMMLQRQRDGLPPARFNV
ncbi:MAG: tetratricopeptide repeat protein [Burkholderiales bacterium]